MLNIVLKLPQPMFPTPPHIGFAPPPPLPSHHNLQARLQNWFGKITSRKTAHRSNKAIFVLTSKLPIFANVFWFSFPRTLRRVGAFEKSSVINHATMYCLGLPYWHHQQSTYYQHYGFYQPSADEEFAMFTLSCFTFELFCCCLHGCEVVRQMTTRRCHSEPTIISRYERQKWYGQEAQMMWGAQIERWNDGWAKNVQRMHSSVQRGNSRNESNSVFWPHFMLLLRFAFGCPWHPSDLATAIQLQSHSAQIFLKQLVFLKSECFTRISFCVLGVR